MTDPTEADPVEMLLRSARDEAVDERFHVTGVMMQYYEVCERELWFASHLEIDRDNAAIVRGTQVDESASSPVTWPALSRKALSRSAPKPCG
jgi:CRISPR-associated exonuclease Cas4